MFKIRKRVLLPLQVEKYKRWSKMVARKFTKLNNTELAEIPNHDK